MSNKDIYVIVVLITHALLNTSLLPELQKAVDKLQKFLVDNL